jgi:hypothetical protein
VDVDVDGDGDEDSVDVDVDGDGDVDGDQDVDGDGDVEGDGDEDGDGDGEGDGDGDEDEDEDGDGDEDEDGDDGVGGAMQDLVGEVVIVRDSTCSSTEGRLRGTEVDPSSGVVFYVLERSRQVNYVDARQSPPTCEAWDIEGLNRIACHLTVGIHKSHLAPR